MAEFASPDSYRQFAEDVKQRTRYVYSRDVQTFLTAVMETSKKRTHTLPESAVFWRAQRGYTWRMENPGAETESEIQDAFGPERMVPKPEFISDGRVNPRGIPCLYLASTKQTAMAEVRPWRGSYISLGATASFALLN